MNPSLGHGPSDMLPLRILCIDDNQDIADSTADLLRIMGFDACACYDGFTALEEASRFQPSVCLIDLNMPGMDGDELAVRLISQREGMPLVLVAMTAMNNEESAQRIRDAGFAFHLVKPVDPHQLLKIVDILFDLWSSATPRSSASNDGLRGSHTGESPPTSC